MIVIKAQEHRSQEHNRVLRSLDPQELIKDAVVPIKRRKLTRATRSSQQKRLDSKSKRWSLCVGVGVGEASRREAG